MKKNVGALTLISSLVIATGAFVAPASANAENISLVSNPGTVYAVPSGEIFTLRTFYPSGISSAGVANLKARITTNGSYQLNYDHGTTLAAAKDMATLNGNLASASTSAVFTVGTNLNFIGLTPNSASTTTSYSATIQMFEDSDGSGSITAGEWVSAVRTVTWHKLADVTWSAVLSTSPFPTAAAATKTVRVTATNVNMAQMTIGSGANNAADATSVAVVFQEDTTTAGTFSPIGAAAVPVTYNDDDDRFEATSTASDAAYAAGDKIKVDVYLLAKDATTAFTSAATGAAFGSLAGRATYVFTVASTTASTLSSNVLTGKTANTTDNGSGTIAVRREAGALTAYVEAKNNASPAVGVSGVTVTFTISEGGSGADADFSTAGSLAAGGNTLRNTNTGSVQSITATAVTDANGKASLPITFTSLDAADTFTISAAAQGLSASASTVTVTSTTAGAPKLMNVVSGESLTPELIRATGVATNIDLALLDNFGSLITGSNYSVTVTSGGTSLSGNIVSGRATVSWPSSSTATTQSLTVQPKKDGSNAGSTLTVEVTTAASKTPSLISINAGADSALQTGTTATGVADYGKTSGSNLARNKKTFAAADGRLGASLPESTDATAVKFSGTVTDANGAAYVGPLSIAGTGLDFLATDFASRDSIALHTDENGAFAVAVLSNKAGKITATVTAGSITKTQDFTFAAAAAADGSVLTLTTPTNATASSVYSVIGKLTDAFGNPVEVASAGSGSNPTLSVSNLNGFVGGSLPTTTNAAGEFSFVVLVGAQGGSQTITATFDADGTGTSKSPVSVSKTVGALEAVANIGSFSGRVAVRVENAKGSDVSVKIGKKWYKFVAKNDNYLQSWKSRKGTTVAVSVYVDGELQNVQTITVK